MDSFLYHKSQLQLQYTGNFEECRMDKHAIDFFVSDNSPNIHLPKFCSNYYAAMKNINKALLLGIILWSSLHEKRVHAVSATASEKRQKKRDDENIKEHILLSEISTAPHSRSCWPHSAVHGSPHYWSLLYTSHWIFLWQNVANEPVELQCKSPVYHNCCIGMLWKSGSGASECPSSYQAHELTINGFPGHLTCSYEVAIKSCDPLGSSKLHQACASSAPGQAHWEQLQRDVGRFCIYTSLGLLLCVVLSVSLIAYCLLNAFWSGFGLNVSNENCTLEQQKISLNVSLFHFYCILFRFK